LLVDIKNKLSLGGPLLMGNLMPRSINARNIYQGHIQIFK